MKHRLQQGFTLLEILVVVSIMGFLVAMVAPRFAGIVDGTIDTVCDNNQERLIKAIAAYHDTNNGKLPGGLVNLVLENDNDPTDVLMPPHTGQLGFPDEGQATFFESFYDRNQFQLHTLSESEARELRGLGIATVYQLNQQLEDGDFTGALQTDIAALGESTPLRKAAVAEGMQVLMIGMGATDDTDNSSANWAGPLTGLSDDDIADVDSVDYGGWGNPEWIGRIMLGVGEDSSLIQEQMISAAGLCPGGINNEQVYWNNYNLVVPRLAATSNRITGADKAVLGNVVGKAFGGQYREFDLTEAGESYAFLTQCPEGHRYPTPDDLSAWAIQVGFVDGDATATLAALEITEY
jgi:prepilin-type N-terminal cleavage/methylation domain-containing protein